MLKRDLVGKNGESPEIHMWTAYSFCHTLHGSVTVALITQKSWLRSQQRLSHFDGGEVVHARVYYATSVYIEEH